MSGGKGIASQQIRKCIRAILRQNLINHNCPVKFVGIDNFMNRRIDGNPANIMRANKNEMRFTFPIFSNRP